MAEKKKSPDIKNKKNVNYSKYVFIAVLVFIAGYFIYSNFFEKSKFTVDKPIPVDPQERIKNIKEPPFIKEGELEFLKSDGKSIIKKIDVELAENDDERSQGLMYRKSMDDERGMLFIFNREELQSFWMKNTIMSLDIIYVNSSKEIIKIHKNTIPFSENSLPSGKPATYVVEVAAGFTDRYSVKEGDKISFIKLN